MLAGNQHRPAGASLSSRARPARARFTPLRIDPGVESRPMCTDRAGRASVIGLFALTLFAGSALLFLLEPMVGRMLLPRLGGAPAVWNTCLVFFQVALLGGYLYARLSARYLSPRRQLVSHAFVLLLPLLVLPIRVAHTSLPATGHSPVVWLLGALIASAGLPFFVVATTAPLLQQWFAHTDHPDAEDPYYLYQASNLGSFAALVAYPFLFEPALGLRMQGLVWAGAYGAFVLLVFACAFVAWRHRATAAAAVDHAPASSSQDRRADDTLRRGGGQGVRGGGVTWTTRLRWTALAAVPSSLLMGLTTYLSTDIAAVPLLWVIPLALYLLTFVVAFARRPLVSNWLLTVLTPIVVLPLLLGLMIEATRPAWALGPLHVTTFVVVALMCHRQLADARPDRRHLTSFYLWISVGGAAGGLFNAIAAPLLFRTILEYPLALLAACFLKPPLGKRGEGPTTVRDIWLPIGVGALTLAATHAASRVSDVRPAAAVAALAVPAAVCYLCSARPVRFGLAVAALLVAGFARPSAIGTLVYTERSFFGMHRVVDDAASEVRWLLHGTTIHGGQSLNADRRLEPLTYYTRSGPIGQVFEALTDVGRPLKVAIVGLGAGGAASYARIGDEWTFFEIDPVVVRLARDSGYFTFLRDSPAAANIIVGDGRLALARAAPRRFDIVLLDAFSSDAVPIHLLTREAVRSYLDRLEPGGLLVFNTSNRYLTVHRAVADLAADAGLVHLWQRDDEGTKAEYKRGKSTSDFVIVARRREDFGVLADSRRWLQVPGPRGRVWTDDYANPFGLLIW
jgi:hypothetical protein